MAALLTKEFEAGDETFGMDGEALEVAARDIRAGIPPQLDEMELLRHERTFEAFLAVTGRDLLWLVVRLFLPALLFIGALLLVSLIASLCVPR